MKPELEPLATDVLALLRAEKPIAELESTAKAAILAAVEAQIGLPPVPGGGGGGGAGAAASGGAAATSVARAVAAIAATFAIGVATGVVIAPSVRAPAPPAPIAQVAATIPAARAPSAVSSSEAPLPAVSVGSLPAASPTAAPRASRVDAPEGPAPSARGLGAERSLLDIARAALARGEAAEALAAVDRHGREYPEGALVEEREALGVKALVALGRRDEARARAQRFEQRFPNGLLLRAVKGSVGEP
ncbi:MAG TPA: hypothetical protein VLT33_32715 [Labilithrix sp.]|nr:hypothetical protein [Labilithrix sp.]